MYSYPFYNAASKSPSTIEVLGEGAVTATPDRAIVVLGAITEGNTLQLVQAENAKIVTNIIQSMQKIGIPLEKIQTNDFRIDTQYDYVDGKQIFRGYRVTDLLQITTDRLDQSGLIVDTAVAQGANSVSSIRFTLAQPEVYANHALSLAIRNARQKAVTIAQTLGVNIAAVPFRIQELSRSNEPMPFKATFHAESTGTPVQPGELMVNASVRAWYCII
ncbi:SIMPL domain-containing protein [Paenibacillus sp. N3.4]|uniref:SIMPL domain-containing protein n=1 Tax=Paenibacillus sp. N3.4 TaxID=2603222 RepID=UPI0021C4AA04|nr:SIMPL domain-containing protein [Paenibacillus sp. N3.4]